MNQIQQQSFDLLYQTKLQQEQITQQIEQKENELQKHKEEQQQIINDLSMIHEIQKKINENEELQSTIQTKVNEERSKKQQRMVQLVQLHSQTQSSLNCLTNELQIISNEIPMHEEMFYELMNPLLDEPKEESEYIEYYEILPFIQNETIQSNQILPIISTEINEDTISHVIIENQNDNSQTIVSHELWSDYYLYKTLGWYNSTVQRVEHLPFLPYAQKAGGFIAKCTHIPSKIPFIRTVFKPINVIAEAIYATSYSITNRENITEYFMRYSEMFNSSVEQNGMINTIGSTIKNSAVMITMDYIIPSLIELVFPFYSLFKK